MPMTILGIGTAVPRHQISQAESTAVAQRISASTPERGALLARIQRRSGVNVRHSVLLEAAEHVDGIEGRLPFYGDSSPSTGERIRRFETHAAPLALEVARRALADAGLGPERITHLVTVSCTGFQAPGFDLALMGQLPLNPDVERTHVGFMGCHGSLNGLRVARAFVEADPSACVLLCSVELCSLHMHYGWDPEKVVANALFADGAGALVAGGPAADASPLQVLGSGSTLIPGSSDLMSWTITDHGFEMTLSSRVPDTIAAHLRPWLERWLSARGQSVASIGSWALHPGGPRILTAVAAAAELNPSQVEPSAAVLRQFGNMSSATILFILERLHRTAAPRPWVALAFGPGLSVEASLLG
ncbi:MAG: type III polyketide synthase [Cyanobacteria bacterium]|nr:type III polyketide synthase [Cyanobacteriota bacterium]